MLTHLPPGRFLQQSGAGPDWYWHWPGGPVLSDRVPASPPPQHQPRPPGLQLSAGETRGGGRPQLVRGNHPSLHRGVSSSRQVWLIFSVLLQTEFQTKTQKPMNLWLWHTYEPMTIDTSEPMTMRYLWAYDYDILMSLWLWDTSGPMTYLCTYQPMTVRYLWKFDYEINLWHTCAYIWDSVTSCHKVRKSILYKTELKNIYLWKEFSANTVWC